MIKKWFDIISDHRISLRERMFRIATGICMIAIAFTLPMGRNIWNILILLGSLVVISFIVRISIKKKSIHAGATAISMLLLMLFPLTFFSAGGFYSGVPEWFVLCFIYVCITLRGKRRVVFFGLCTAETMLCYGTAFYFPQLAASANRQSALFDSAFSMIMVGLLTSVLLMFLNRMYEEENALSQQQKKEIEELNRAENHFFSSMSHEIRTPINTIIGLNEILLREDISEEVAENARNIQGASKLLLTLINDILDISKIKSGKMEIVNVSYETGALFSEIVNMIWIKAKEKGLEFKLHVDSSIPSMLCGDEVRIKQILINLLSNAVKYTSEGTVSLSVRCERKGLNRVRVWYSVEDTGMGVKKENIPYIFNAFRRVDEEKNRYIEGTGLGLSIVQQLVNLMGGEISVNSVYTKGSKFIVMLEQDIVDERALGTFTLTSRSRVHEGDTYQQSFEAPDAHILVVDDNDMNLMVVSKLLAATKIQIDLASSGAECLQLTQNHHYDCILMDHMMPEMDGIECLHALRVQPGGLCQDVPVVALTANAGRFLDEEELMAEELLMHIARGGEGSSQPPDVEDYERFFAEKLTEAQNVIHITMAKHVSDGYQNAIEAAKSFENVTVVDSGHLSSSLGLSVLCAASMAEHHAAKEEIVDAIRRVERLISSAFIINSTHMMCRSGRISKKVQVICDALLLHPVLRLRKSKMVVGGMEMGDFSRAAKKYIKRTLQDTENIDRRILFITYSGMEEKKLQYIQNLVRQYCPFEKIYLQKASSAIASNCGPGSFGLLFMRRDDSANTFFQSTAQDTAAS